MLVTVKAGFSFQRFSGFLLTAIYMVITLAPLAPVALHSKTVARAVTGECAGDCTICGCSLEAQADKTCCCAKKQQMSQSRTLAAVSNQSETVAKKRTCCAGKKSGQIHDGQGAQRQNKDHHAVTVLTCGYPCGSSKLFAMSGVSFEILPGSVPTHTTPCEISSGQYSLVYRPVYRHGEPPDPPPKLSSLS